MPVAIYETEDRRRKPEARVPIAIGTMPHV